jgi:hypothetical protein
LERKNPEPDQSPAQDIRLPIRATISDSIGDSSSNQFTALRSHESRLLRTAPTLASGISPSAYDDTTLSIVLQVAHSVPEVLSGGILVHMLDKAAVPEYIQRDDLQIPSRERVAVHV